MKKFKTLSCIAVWATLIWMGLSKLSTAIHDENVVAQMSQSTYDEIVDTLTINNNGFAPSEHQIVTYYYERYAK